MAEQKKANKMQIKTEECRKAFNLPESETVIQDYTCSYNVKQGRLYITQNYVCFLPGIIGSEKVVPFRRFKSIKKDKSALVFDNAITIETDEGEKVFFGAFVHRDEAYNLIEYLWQYPPMYMDLDVEDEDDDLQVHVPEPDPKNPSTAANVKSNSNSGGSFNTSQGNFNNSNNNTNTNHHYNNNNNSTQTQSQITAQVDTQTSRNALRIANETRQIGSATLVELTLQAEQLDRVENNVEEVISNMDKANHLLKGIESLPGALSNALSGTKIDSQKRGYVDRSLEIKKELPPVDYHILQKMPNDFLQPATLRFIEDKFMCIKPGSDKPEANSIWSYEKVESLVVRARHQHLDIRFIYSTKDKATRFRLCTSYIQQVVNELSLRCLPATKILFEPGTRRFPYGKLSINKETTSSRENVRSALFKRGGGASQRSVTKTVFKDAPDEVKTQLRQQEQDLDDISDALSDISAIAATMGNELDRQTAHLDRIESRVDTANVRVKQTNDRINRLL